MYVCVGSSWDWCNVAQSVSCIISVCIFVHICQMCIFVDRHSDVEPGLSKF